MSSKITLTLEQLQFMEESHRFTWLNNAQEFLDSLKEGIVEFEEYKQRQKDAEKAEAEAVKAAKKAERDLAATRKEEEAKQKRSKKLAADVEKAKKWAENMEKSEHKKEGILFLSIN